MTIQAGSRLGPYEVVAMLGAGGMGEVYRVRDPRLHRDVAAKVLPPSFASDAQRLKRFEQEALATATLKHPNILTVYDIGTYRLEMAGSGATSTATQECPYIVSELLEGESLRDRLRGGALPLRKALDFGLQIARGLGAAHDKGIVHRDLKPDNIFLTEDGQAKILDFGLAKLTLPERSSDGQSLTLEVVSDPGTVLGTLGYMAPEQVRGKAADSRSDLFSFGAILYEMLSGKRAFTGDSAADVMSAILHQEPPELAETNRSVSPALERIVRHCLEKNPAERFQSARDVAFDLEMMSGTSGSSTQVPVVDTAARLRKFAPLLWALAIVAAAAIAFSMGRQKGTPLPEFRALSFERGAIPNARFAPDGRSVIYDAAWDGKPVRVFTTPFDSAQPRSMEFDPAHLYGVSRSGELAIGTGGQLGNHLDYRGATLARVPIAGGAPRAVLDSVSDADWAPDGNLAVVHAVNGHDRIEFPIGKVLYETSGWITGMRVSPKGDQLAFLEHPRWPDDRGVVAVVDTSGQKRVLSDEAASLNGLAWSQKGEIWFTATAGTAYRSLQAVDLRGKRRTILRIPGVLTLLDVSTDGSVLLGVNSEKVGVKGHRAGETGERDLSWSGWTIAADVSPDRKWLLLNEQSPIVGTDYLVGMRSFEGSSPVRLGIGNAGNFSPDGKWITAVQLTGATRTILYPTGVGTAKEIPASLEKLQFAHMADSRHLLLEGYESGHGVRCYFQDIETGITKPVSPEGVANCVGSPDGRMVAASDGQGKLMLYPVDGAPPKAMPDDLSGMIPIRFGTNGTLYASRVSEFPLRVFEINVATGKRQVIAELKPGDAAGLIGISPVAMSTDASTYAYSYRRTLSELYLVEGLK
jgi:hypothetical protein